MEMSKEKIMALVEQVVNKLKADDELMAQFQKEPVKALEKLLGVDLPEEQINSVVTGIKAKLKLDDLHLDDLAGLAGNMDTLKDLGKLFGGK